MSEQEGGCVAAEEANKTEAPKIRRDWYQTDTHVVVTLLVKNVDEAKLNVAYSPRTLKVKFPLPSNEETELILNLAHEISEVGNTCKVYPSKIEIKLKKLEGGRWDTLEGSVVTEVKSQEVPKYPSSSLKQKDWDKVVTTIEDEQPEGEAALNALFSKIYTEGSDEVRKAMNKSFSESGGTVLSTNWDEVKKDKVNIKPPQGMEFKKWD